MERLAWFMVNPNIDLTHQFQEKLKFTYYILRGWGRYVEGIVNQSQPYVSEASARLTAPQILFIKTLSLTTFAPLYLPMLTNPLLREGRFDLLGQL